ncbi:hypothetical protein [Congregibacter litoralis]|uniref:Putative integral membrane protein n=1 Tax=Congregibacter litoralis KT71 TaxID=314285 RepID=A4ABU1_9GAMM|nr:hypothetical protein [Congregibacter litoralis]EAQ96604.2 putative integral membrane protein [Congregibacter litoralis KT71]
MGSFLTELRRRRVFRTSALYILGAWGLLQIADVLFPALGLAESDIRYLLFIAIGGFPVALIFGWLFDISSDGIHRTAAASAEELEARIPLRASDYLILTSLLIVLGVIGYGVVQNAENIPLPSGNPDTQADAGDWERSEGPPMIGVLPFAHLGSTEDGEFFAKGVHDDLLTSLSKISTLRVISRTSVLQYADTTKAIPDIGRELRADAILEGGVRVAGNQIRINAQLIDARSDEHLWAETFDRELSANNIFEVQSEIARAISTALQTTLTEDDSDSLDIIPTSNLAAYRAYHEIMQWRDTIHLNATTLPTFAEGLEKAFTLDPEFTRPMVELVNALALRMFRNPDKEALPRVEELITRIGEIAPDSADHYTAQSFYFYYVLEDYERANALIEKAQTRAPSDPKLVSIQSWIQRRQGDFEGWLASAKRAYQLAPTDAELGRSLVVRLMVMHRYDEAKKQAELVANTLETEDPNLAMLRSQLAFAGHHSLPRLEQSIKAILEKPHAFDRGTFDLALLLWELQSAQGKYAQATETLTRYLPAADAYAGAPPPGQLSLTLEMGLLNALIMDDQATLGDFLAEAKEALTITTETPDEYLGSMNPLSGALLAHAEGRSELVAESIAPLWSDPKVDRAIWLRRNQICQLLALAGAATEATDCLRNSLDEPSGAWHFLELLLAYYDPVRDSAEFQALWQELLREGWVVEE